MKKKNWLFVLLFAWVVFIDWINGTQNGYYRVVAENSLGLLMGILTLRCYAYNKEKYKKTDCIWTLLWILGSVIGSFIWTWVKGPVNAWQYILAAVDVGVLGFTAVRVFYARAWKNIVWKKDGVAASLLAGMSIFMVFSRYYEIWQIWFLAMFLCFYLTKMGAEEEDAMWDAVSKGVILAFFMIQIWAYGFRPYDEVRYKGPYNNTNLSALFYLVTYMMVLYRIHVMYWKEKQNLSTLPRYWRIQKVLYYILAGGLVSFIFFTICRTALIVVVILTGVYGILSNRYFLKEKWGNMIVRLGSIFLCAMITFPCVYGSIRYLPCILHRPVWFEFEYSVDKVHSFDPWDSPKYISLEEFLETAIGRIGLSNVSHVKAAENSLTVEENVSVAEKVLSTGNVPVSEQDKESVGTSTNTLLSGEDAEDSGKIRLRIWKEYIARFNWSGHTVKEGQIQITEDFSAWHGQNVFVQVFFCYGILSGILFVGLMIWYGYRSIKFLGKETKPVALMPFMVFLVFLTFGMLEAVWYPGQSILTLMYLMGRLLLNKSK